MKIGIMGGTFNPIHNGHLLIGKYARDQFGLDVVIYIPNGRPAYKSIDKDISPKNRFDMVELAVVGKENFIASDLEIRRSGITYTIDTIKTLQKLYVDTDFFFIIGEDSLFSLEGWKSSIELFQICSFLVFKRKDSSEEKIKAKIRFLEEKYGARIYYIKSPVINISSTEIRKKVLMGRNIEDLVPVAVEKYIYDNSLYGDD